MKNLICLALFISVSATPVFAQVDYMYKQNNELLIQALKANDDRITYNKKYRMSLIDWVYDLKQSGASDNLFTASIDKYLKQLLDMKPDADAKTFSRIEGTLDDIKLGIKSEIYKHNTRAASNPTNGSNSGKSLDEYLDAAYNSIEIQDNKTAYETLNKAIETNPNSWEAYMLRGAVLNFGFKNYKAALRDFNQSILLKSDNALAYLNRGECYENIGNLLEAVKDLGKCIQLDKDNLMAYFRRGIVKSGLGDRYGAISDYDVVIRMSTTTNVPKYILATSYNNKGYCLVELGKYSEALPLVNKALELDDKEWFIWDSRGEIYYNYGNYKKCIDDMNHAIDLKPSANSFYLRGLSKIKLNDKASGCKDLSKAGELGEMKAYDAIRLQCK